MARPSKNAAIDFDIIHDLTHGLIERASCPDDLPFVLLKDSEKRGLRLRVTQAGGKHWQFETRVNGKLFTRALGSWDAISLAEARTEAHRLRGLTEKGIDPRELERKIKQDEEVAEAAALALATEQAKKAAAQKLTVGEVWAVYIEKRRPLWGDLHYRDHINKAHPGGQPSGARGAGKRLTKPGPLAALMPLALKDLDQATIGAWAADEGKERAASARLAWRLLTVFLTWCAEQPEYGHLLPLKNPAKTKAARESLGKPGVKKDALQKGQLAAWFDAVRHIQNPTIAVCLQVLLLTGARLNEVLTMKWTDINFQWKGITIHDKVEGERDIPLTPFVENLITALPRRNEFVFGSVRTLDMGEKNIRRRERKSTTRGTPAPLGDALETSKTGHISEPNTPHARACRVAGLDGLTLHGLRRSFKSLTEWLEIPAGVVAQIMGHKPSATAEKHYTVRPLDLLRIHHEKIEAWMLEQAGIVFNAHAAETRLRVVAK